MNIYSNSKYKTTIQLFPILSLYIKDYDYIITKPFK